MATKPEDYVFSSYKSYIEKKGEEIVDRDLILSMVSKDSRYRRRDTGRTISFLAISLKDFDPVLLKVFVNMIGIFPVGTLVELDTGEMGLVIETPEETMKERPRILVLVSDGKDGFTKGDATNLAQRDPDTGLFSRNIVRSMHPGKYGIQPAEFLL